MALAEKVSQCLTSLPTELTVTENLNVQPVKLPLFVSSQLGFLAIYLLTDFDKLVRKIILAHHTAVIDRPQMERWLNEGAHPLRSTFALAYTLAQRYRLSGAQRDDFASNNAVARTARDRLGDLPQDVLEGTRRSRYAPPIVRRSGLAQEAPRTQADTSTDGDAAISSADAPVERNSDADPSSSDDLA
jgi:integrating conjugative element protein (TIGR03761 family)